MGGGAWPYLVGGLVCLLNCDNERDLNLLNSCHRGLFTVRGLRARQLLRGTAVVNTAEV